MTVPQNQTSTSQINIQLILVSFIMLFAEIGLIRWLSTEVRIFAYINNLVLLSCFLGIGLGAYYSKRKIYVSLIGFGLAAQLFLIWIPISFSIKDQSLHPFKDIPILLSSFTDSFIWYESTMSATFFITALGILSTLFLFAIVLLTFIPLGQLLGRLLDDHKNTIVAYSLNVVASIGGVWIFSAFSFFYTPPWLWFVVVLIGLVVMLVYPIFRSRKMIASLFVFSITILLMIFFPSEKPDLIKTTWSPYQKLELYPHPSGTFNIDRGYLLNVNNVGYMGMLDFSDSMVNAHPLLFDINKRRLSQYDFPYQLKRNPENVLILGAGAGNDVSGALRNNARCIDAVEIDPGIYKLGKEYHPEKPYDNPLVNMIIDDARSFLKRTDKFYDLISFGLLDAHTSSSSYNNIRIDHYVYTLESFQEARSRLESDGIMTVAFEAQRPWIKMRLYNLLEEAFGHPPVAIKYGQNIFGWGGTMFITALDTAVLNQSLTEDPLVKRFVGLYGEDFENSSPEDRMISITVDDWPYLYLLKPQIPKLHLIIMAILLVMIVAGKEIVLRKGVKLEWHFFFLGAAFLLLEFQNISKSTLLFGSTWLVNSYVITGILVLILLANLVVAKFKINNVRLLYILLILSSLIVYFLPLEIFSGLEYWIRAVVVSIILNIPIFFAGMVFIISFRRTPYKNLAYGSNLIGAAVGGIIESFSFIIGINALLLIVIVFYAMSFLFFRKAVTE